MKQHWGIRFVVGAFFAALMASQGRAQMLMDPPLFERSWGAFGTGSGQFSGPTGIAIGPDGDVYVADTNNNRIQVFTSDGAYLRQWSVTTPAGLAVDPNGNVFVAAASHVMKFSSDGSLISSFSTLTSNGMGLALDSNNNVYVAAYDQHAVQKFTKDGLFLSQWVDEPELGIFHYPIGLAIDSQQHVYVSTFPNMAIHEYSSDGTSISSSFNSPLWLSFYNPAGLPDGPNFLAVGPSNNLYVTDTYSGVMHIFSNSGTELTQFGQWGTGAGSVKYPAGIALDASGDVYVADAGNSRIDKFRPDTAGFAVTISVAGRGTITRSRSKAQYPQGSPISLVAAPLPGARFVGWSGDTTTTDSALAIVVNHALNYVAHFGPDPAAVPVLTAASDVPGDQGSFVSIRWQASPLDVNGVGTLCCYALQRSSPPVDPSWTEIDRVGIQYSPAYESIVSTPADSTAADRAVFRYRVVALAAYDTSAWVSNEVDGYSVDNLAPPAPATVSGMISSGYASFFWPAVSAADLAYYAVYRDVSGPPPIDAAHRVGTNTVPQFTDSPGYYANYAVTAVDRHGNESTGTPLVPLNPAGIKDGPVPSVFLVGDAVPMPAHDHVSLSIGLPQAMNATVEVIDTQGRVVRRLLAGWMNPGWATVEWRGDQADGLAARAGVYFVRVSTSMGQRTRRVALIR